MHRISIPPQALMLELNKKLHQPRELQRKEHLADMAALQNVIKIIEQKTDESHRKFWIRFPTFLGTSLHKNIVNPDKTLCKFGK